ncbi:MAG: HAMP domain-containing histidine kinase [Oscillospiraceae bacterium]|nr:HAMP domain-containing histidine kinase [Oscillospiraceae bacterium]
MKLFPLSLQPIRDSRVKRRSFSKLRFITVFLILISFAIGEALMLANHYHSDTIPPQLINAFVFYWAIAAGGYSLFETVYIRWKYEKPMNQMSVATKQVAEGNFSIKLKPRHSEEHLDYLDVMFLDFNTMVEELSSTEMLKQDFISNISHEIKTPLAVIQSYITLMQSDTISAEQRKEYADTIYHATEQLTTLVTNILRLSKLENQSICPVAQPYDVCRQLSDCVMSFADKLEEKQIDFSAEIEDRVFVIADESLIEIVWNNLLQNAIKYTEQGGQINLSQRSDYDSVTVQIADNGCGMDSATVKHIFEKFYQGDTAHAKEGYGLGLALTAKIIALSDGKIQVTSAPGKGSVFTVQLHRQA